MSFRRPRSTPRFKSNRYGIFWYVVNEYVNFLENVTLPTEEEARYSPNASYPPRVNQFEFFYVDLDFYIPYSQTTVVLGPVDVGSNPDDERYSTIWAFWNDVDGLKLSKITPFVETFESGSPIIIDEFNPNLQPIYGTFSKDQQPVLAVEESENIRIYELPVSGTEYTLVTSFEGVNPVLCNTYELTNDPDAQVNVIYYRKPNDNTLYCRGGGFTQEFSPLVLPENYKLVKHQLRQGKIELLGVLTESNRKFALKSSPYSLRLSVTDNFNYRLLPVSGILLSGTNQFFVPDDAIDIVTSSAFVDDDFRFIYTSGSRISGVYTPDILVTSGIFRDDLYFSYSGTQPLEGIYIDISGLSSTISTEIHDIPSSSISLLINGVYTDIPLANVTGLNLGDTLDSLLGTIDIANVYSGVIRNVNQLVFDFRLTTPDSEIYNIPTPVTLIDGFYLTPSGVVIQDQDVLILDTISDLGALYNEPERVVIAQSSILNLPILGSGLEIDYYPDVETTIRDSDTFFISLNGTDALPLRATYDPSGLNPVYTLRTVAIDEEGYALRERDTLIETLEYIPTVFLSGIRRDFGIPSGLADDSFLFIYNNPYSYSGVYRELFANTSGIINDSLIFDYDTEFRPSTYLPGNQTAFSGIPVDGLFIDYPVSYSGIDSIYRPGQQVIHSGTEVLTINNFNFISTARYRETFADPQVSSSLMSLLTPLIGDYEGINFVITGVTDSAMTALSPYSGNLVVLQNQVVEDFSESRLIPYSGDYRSTVFGTNVFDDTESRLIPYSGNFRSIVIGESVQDSTTTALSPYSGAYKSVFNDQNFIDDTQSRLLPYSGDYRGILSVNLEPDQTSSLLIPYSGIYGLESVLLPRVGGDQSDATQIEYSLNDSEYTNVISGDLVDSESLRVAFGNPSGLAETSSPLGQDITTTNALLVDGSLTEVSRNVLTISGATDIDFLISSGVLLVSEPPIDETYHINVSLEGELQNIIGTLEYEIIVISGI